MLCMCKKMYLYGLKFVAKEKEVEKNSNVFLYFDRNICDVLFDVCDL
jgi:hypothetical protein